MSHMTEEENKQIEVLLKCCRRQCILYKTENQDWEELVKAKEEERLQQEKEERSTTQAKMEQPKAGGLGTKSSVLKVKTSKGKEVVVEQVKEEKQPESATEKVLEEKGKDKLVLGGDKSPDPNKFEEESYKPPVEFEDPLFELMEGQGMEEEYKHMTLEEEEAIISHLTP